MGDMWAAYRTTAIVGWQSCAHQVNALVKQPWSVHSTKQLASSPVSLFTLLFLIPTSKPSYKQGCCLMLQSSREELIEDIESLKKKIGGEQ